MYVECNNSYALRDDPCEGFTVDGANRSHVTACTPLRSFDYFTGSSVSYILTFGAVVLFAICKYLNQLMRLINTIFYHHFFLYPAGAGNFVNIREYKYNSFGSSLAKILIGLLLVMCNFCLNIYFIFSQ